VSECGDQPAGVEWLPFDPAVRRLSIHVQPGSPPAPTTDVERAWSEMARRNPRLYNGPILAVRSIDASTGRIVAGRDTYQRLVVQPQVATGVRQLSVTGLLIRGADSGREEVLLGRRSGETRMYTGLWELGPAGGLEPPPRHIPTIDHDALLDQLRRECREEAALEITGPGEPIGIVYDPLGHSHDIVLKVAVEPGAAPAKPEHAWEYRETRWIAAADLASFDRAHASEIIPPTRALIRALWP
jgi:8-oxo-dGTP pyrophosphatase MutT (NUDIX family)